MNGRTATPTRNRRITPIGVFSRWHYDGHSMRRIPLLTALLLFALVVPAGAQTVDGCSARFPDTVWDRVEESGPITVYGAEVQSGLFDRYAREFGDLATTIEEEIGGADGLVVCIFPDVVPWDAQALGWPEGQRLHTASFADEGVVVVSSYLISAAIDAGRNGIIHAALWRTSDGSYPGVLADDVKGWYRNRLERSVESVHTLFVRQNTGLAEPWPPTPWLAGAMEPVLLWNPEFSYGGGGDFANFVAGTAGTEVLADPAAGEIEALDAQWRQALFDESGAIPGGSKGWIIGVVLVTAILILAVAMALMTRRARRRIEQDLRDAAEKQAAARRADIQARPVQPSVSVGRGSRDPGVGRGKARTGVIDRDGRDGSPPLGKVGSDGDRVATVDESPDDRYRHPGFDDDV